VGFSFKGEGAMAIDPNLLDHMAAQSLQNTGFNTNLVQVMGTNLVQGFGVVLETVIQQAASVTDDAALNAAQNGAALSPAVGRPPGTAGG